jgi:hypothetical protein
MHPTNIRRSDALGYGLCGAVTFLFYFWLAVNWLTVAAWLMGRERVIFDEQPGWILELKRAVDFVPWLIGAALLVFGLLRRRWIPVLAYAGAFVLGFGLLFGVLFGRPVINDYASRVAFDSAAWKAENGDAAQGIRVRMVDDLLARHKLVGMARAQVEELLGVPPATPYFREYDYVYWLGPERGFISIDSEWLVVKINEGVVVSAKIVTD